MQPPLTAQSHPLLLLLLPLLLWLSLFLLLLLLTLTICDVFDNMQAQLAQDTGKTAGVAQEAHSTGHWGKETALCTFTVHIHF